MTRVGSNTSGAGDQPDLDRDDADRALRNRFQRKGDSFNLGHGARDSGLGDRHHESPHEQDARAKAFQSRLTDKAKGDRAGPSGAEGKGAPAKAKGGATSLFASGSRQEEPGRAADEPGGARASMFGLWDPLAAPNEREGGREHAQGEDDRKEPRLLAVAEPPADSLSLMFAAVTPAPVPTSSATAAAPDAKASTAERVAGVAARVESAIQAELTVGGTETVSLAIPIDPAADGLIGLTVSIGPEGLDILLTRAGGPASVDLVNAATSLAQRLQRRFTRKTVRVLERVVEGSPAAEGPGPHDVADPAASLGQGTA